MRVHVVSDIHGNAEALARAGEGADALVVLGDLIDFIDYADHGGGILGALFGAEKVAVLARLRRDGDRRGALEYGRTLWSGLEDPAAAVEEAIREQYRVLFAALPTPTYAIAGNVDVPKVWPEFAREGLWLMDGEVTKIGGLRFGFVGGSIQPPDFRPRPGRAFAPYLRPVEEFDATVAGLGEVDVLCSHIPPAVPELAYDVVTRRQEMSSESLLRSIRSGAPRWALFGHIHQPLAQRMRLGRTECVNVGHFKLTGRPFVLRW